MLIFQGLLLILQIVNMGGLFLLFIFYSLYVFFMQMVWILKVPNSINRVQRRLGTLQKAIYGTIHSKIVSPIHY